MQVSLLLNIEPKALARARASNGRMYYTQAKQDEMNELSWAIQESIQESIVDKGLLKYWVDHSKKIEITLVFGIRLADSLAHKKRDEMSGKPHTQKPDLDNLIKNILDRGSGILWSDDKFIYSISALKVWSKLGYVEIGVNYE